MIDDSNHYWNLIVETANDPPGMSLRHRPWLEEALAHQDLTVDRDWDGETLQRLCLNLVQLREVLAGEDG